MSSSFKQHQQEFYIPVGPLQIITVLSRQSFYDKATNDEHDNNIQSIFLIIGNGGDSGKLKVVVNRVDGNVELRSCRGSGAPPGTNGRGGQGTTE